VLLFFQRTHRSSRPFSAAAAGRSMRTRVFTVHISNLLSSSPKKTANDTRNSTARNRASSTASPELQRRPDRACRMPVRFRAAFHDSTEHVSMSALRGLTPQFLKIQSMTGKAASTVSGLRYLSSRRTKTPAGRRSGTKSTAAATKPNSFRTTSAAPYSNSGRRNICSR
jgi:hypothetical protein